MAQFPKPFPLILNPQKGIAPHPLLGLSLVRNVDTSTNPGVAKVTFKPTVSGSTISGQPQWIVGVGTLYMIDDLHKVYKSTDSGATWTVIGDGTNGAGQNGTGAGQGLAIWKNYLFAIGTGVSVYGPLDSSPSWTTGWVFTLSYANVPLWCPAFASIDGCLYIANGNKVHKVQEATAPFAPGTGASYTATTAAITLASQYNIYHIQDVNQYLALGTAIATINSNAFAKGADIFPYDRSTLTLGIPVKVPEIDIQQMISVKNRLYFFAGRLGRFYVSDLANYEEVFQIPNYIYDPYGGNGFYFYPGAIMFWDGKIYFGLGGGGGGANGNLGIWTYNLKTKALQLEHTISTGRDGTTQSLYPSCMIGLTGRYIVYGWRDVANSPQYGIDYLSGPLYDSYTSVIEGPMLRVGEAMGFDQIGYIELVLAKKLASTQGIKIKYRTNLTDSFTTLATIDFATYGAIQSYKIPAMSLKKLVFLQCRAELTVSSGSSPEFVGLFAHPHE